MHKEPTILNRKENSINYHLGAGVKVNVLCSKTLGKQWLHLFYICMHIYILQTHTVNGAVLISRHEHRQTATFRKTSKIRGLTSDEPRRKINVMAFSKQVILKIEVFSASMPLSLPTLFLIHAFHLDFLVTFWLPSLNCPSLLFQDRNTRAWRASGSLSHSHGVCMDRLGWWLSTAAESQVPSSFPLGHSQGVVEGSSQLRRGCLICSLSLVLQAGVRRPKAKSTSR